MKKNKNKNNNKSTAKKFEDKLFHIALFIGLLPTCFLVFALYSYELSLPLKIMLMFFIFVSVIYGAFSIKQKVIFQLRTATNLMESMAFGDHTIRARFKNNGGALQEFNQMFNKLSVTLAEQRLIGKEKQVLLHKVIAQIDVAIIAVDNNDHITLMNPNAEKLFGCQFEKMSGWPIKELGLHTVLTGASSKVVEFEVDTKQSKAYKKKVYIHIDEYFENGIRHKLIFITDIQNILREEERLAWQRLLRVLSHEINNSLAPIASISETLSKLLANNETSPAVDDELTLDLQEGLAVITERSNSLNSFIQSYQQLARLPAPSKTLFDLELLMKSIASLFDDANIELDERPLTVYADENQLQQVLVNLIKNAQQAMQNNPAGKIILSCQQIGSRIEIQVVDQGMGINNPDNLFVPFYTTKENGSGIGLVLSRQIIHNHGGDLSISNRLDDIGAKATVYLPAASGNN